MRPRLVLIAATCLLAFASLAAAGQPRLMVQVKKPEGNADKSVMAEGILLSRLTETDLDVMATGLGSAAASPLTDMSDLHIHFRVDEVAAGEQPVRVWAVEVVTGEKVVEVEAKAPMRKGGASLAAANRVLEEATKEAADKLVAGLDAYRARLRAEGGPARIELRGAPPKLAEAVAAMLGTKGTEVQERPGDEGARVWLLRTKLDTLEMAAAIGAVIDEKAPKLDCDFVKKYRGSIIVLCEE